jgi:hypothetical protein
LITWLLRFHPKSGQMLENSKMGFLLPKAKTSYKDGNPEPLPFYTPPHKKFDNGILAQISLMEESVKKIFILISLAASFNSFAMNPDFSCDVIDDSSGNVIATVEIDTSDKFAEASQHYDLPKMIHTKGYIELRTAFSYILIKSRTSSIGDSNLGYSSFAEFNLPTKILENLNTNEKLNFVAGITNIQCFKKLNH